MHGLVDLSLYKSRNTATYEKFSFFLRAEPIAELGLFNVTMQLKVEGLRIGR